MESTIKAYIKEAIRVEKSGQKVELKKTQDYDMPSELEVNASKNMSMQSLMALV